MALALVRTHASAPFAARGTRGRRHRAGGVCGCRRDASAPLASLALLVAFFHPWLIVGLAIDVVLLWATLVAAWSPTQLGLEA